MANPETPKPWLGLNDLHLIGKLFADKVPLKDSEMPSTVREGCRADALLDCLDIYLTQAVGEDWMDTEVL